MRNPNPIKRAWRLEKRRKDLGSDNPSCLHCGESDIFCLELDHPVTEGLDKDFKRVECRNDHRRLEFKRDVEGLTTNGQHDVDKTDTEQLRRYLLLHALDLESLSKVLLTEKASRERVADELLKTVVALRRKAEKM